MSPITQANGHNTGLAGLNSLSLPQVGPAEIVTTVPESPQIDEVEVKPGWWQRVTAPKPAKPAKAPKPPSRRQQRRQAKADAKARKAAALVAAGVQQMTTLGRLAVAAIVLGAIGIGVVGFAASFETVTDAMRPSFGGSAWMVPATADLAILVVSGLDILLSWMRMRIPWLRVIPWSLTAAIIYLNTSAATELEFRVAHALPPALFVVMIEVARHVISVRAGIVAGDISDGPRIPRWLVAPMETARLWQIMSIEGVSTLAEARNHHQNRVLAIVALRSRWGLLWRFTAPGELTARYRLRVLTVADVKAHKENDDAKTKKASKKNKQDKETPAAAAKAVEAAAPSKPGKHQARKPSTSRVSDKEALAAIRANLDPDGRIGVKPAARAAGIGVDRARNLLTTNDLRTTES